MNSENPEFVKLFSGYTAHVKQDMLDWLQKDDAKKYRGAWDDSTENSSGWKSQIDGWLKLHKDDNRHEKDYFRDISHYDPLLRRATSALHPPPFNKKGWEENPAAFELDPNKVGIPGTKEFLIGYWLASHKTVNLVTQGAQKFQDNFTPLSYHILSLGYCHAVYDVRTQDSFLHMIENNGKKDVPEYPVVEDPFVHEVIPAQKFETEVRLFSKLILSKIYRMCD